VRVFSLDAPSTLRLHRAATHAFATDDLDTLTEWVVDLFSPVVSKDLTPVSFSPDPFGPELLGSFTYMRTVKDFLALELAWPIADQTELYHTKVR
jgi:insulysin